MTYLTSLTASTMMNAYPAADTIFRDTLPGSGSTKLTKDIVLNPEPDLDAVPVEAEQGIMDGTIMRNGDWKRVNKEGSV